MYSAGMDGWRIIGIDCAVDPADVGVAVGSLHADRLVIEDAVQCAKKSVTDVVCDFVRRDDRILLAVDAPLGWPAALGTALATHRAGDAILVASHALFRRKTDTIVKAETRQQPLDVGADRIARTAVAALTLLAEIRRRLDAEIPLAWSVPPSDGNYAIEVYPAATLAQLGLVPRSYKKREQVGTRMALFDTLRSVAELDSISAVAEAHADAFDAAICVIAGADFLRGLCRAPVDDEQAVAQHEGWIWFRRKPEGGFLLNRIDAM